MDSDGSGLVLIMIVPGLAYFMEGWSGRKTCWPRSCIASPSSCLVTLLWILVGYSLAFGPDHGGVIGGLDWVGLMGVGMSPNPHMRRPFRIRHS